MDGSVSGVRAMSEDGWCFPMVVIDAVVRGGVHGSSQRFREGRGDWLSAEAANAFVRAAASGCWLKQPTPQ